MTPLSLRLAAVLLLLTPAVRAQDAAPSPSASPAPVTDINIVIHTTKGDIALNVFASKTPLTAANFLNLASRKYYDGVKFHRVIHGFMIQGGDPSGTGAGGPGYRFKDEFVPGLVFDKPGVLAMANSGENTNGSQFFITHVPTPHLNGHHTIFGQVTKGQDVVDAIEQGDVIQGIDILDPTAPLFAAEASQIAEWNAAMAAKPPEVRQN